LWQAVAVGAVITAMGLIQLYLFVRRNIQGKGDWDEDVVELMDEDLYRGPVCLVLLVFGVIFLAIGFLR
jgi:hypothetical protein